MVSIDSYHLQFTYRKYTKLCWLFILYHYQTTLCFNLIRIIRDYGTNGSQFRLKVLDRHTNNSKEKYTNDI